MQIDNKMNFQILQHKQNFTGSSQNSAVLPNSKTYQSVPLETSKAYASPQIAQGCKEIKTFDIPHIGKGKLYELSNGHKIVTVPKAGVTHISTIVGAGSSEEPAEKKEVAHLLEHLMAQGCDANQDELNEMGTYSNASTTSCSTTYYMSADVQNNTDLEKLIKTQQRVLTNNNLNENEISKEKNIVIEELKEKGYLVKEENITRKQTLKNLFNFDSTNGAVAQNSIQKIESINKADLDKFKNAFYRPDNMTTFVIGTVNDESIKIINKHFNKTKNPRLKIVRNNMLNIKKDQYINKTKRIDLQSKNKSNTYRNFTELSFIGPKISNKQDTENILVLNKILKNRLKKQDIKIDTGIPSAYTDKNIPQFISISGESSEKNIEGNIKAIYSTINDLTKNPISKDELNKAGEQVLEDFGDYLETNQKFAGFLNDNLLSDSKMDVKSSFDHIKSMSTNDIQNTAKKYFDLNKASLVVVHPNTNATTQTDKVAFTGSAESIKETDIKEYKLPNNLHVIIDSRPGIVKTAVSGKFLYDKKPKNSGIIEAMGASLVRHENYEFPEGNWIDNEGIIIRKSGSSDKVQDIINNIKKELLTPEFSDVKLEEYKKRQKSSNNNSSYSKQQQLLDYNNCFEAKNGICPDVTTTKDLKNYYNDCLKDSQGTFIITVPKEELEQIQPEIIKSLSEMPTVKPHDFSKISNKDNPKDMEKTSIFLAKDSTSDKVEIEKTFKIINNGNIKDEAGILLLNTILNSKLQESLREESGLTYGAHSNFEKYSTKHGALTISTETAKAPLQDNTKFAISKIDNIINNLTTLKINKNTLKSAKKHLKSNLLMPAETAIDRNSHLYSSYQTTYDINHSTNLAKILDTITADDLQKLTKKHLTKHYLLKVSGNKEIIDANKTYLTGLGQIIE